MRVLEYVRVYFDLEPVIAFGRPVLYQWSVLATVVSICDTYPWNLGESVQRGTQFFERGKERGTA